MCVIRQGLPRPRVRIRQTADAAIPSSILAIANELAVLKLAGCWDNGWLAALDSAIEVRLNSPGFFALKGGLRELPPLACTTVKKRNQTSSIGT
jgi:hypothetical protein